jgi:hypothetical protein
MAPMPDTEIPSEDDGLPLPAISEERVALGTAVQARADEVGRPPTCSLPAHGPSPDHEGPEPALLSLSRANRPFWDE